MLAGRHTVVLIALLASLPHLASAELTPGSLDLAANFHTISMRAPFTTPDGAAGNGALVEYRRPGEPTWRPAPPAWIDVRSTLLYAGGAANWARNEARSKIFGLTPGVTYEVRATFIGPVTGAATVVDTITTRALTPPAPALRTLYVDGATGNDGDDGLSALTPKRTVAAAFAIAVAGDRIWIAPGQYPQAAAVTLSASGTTADWIRVTPWPSLPGDVVLEGSGANDHVLVLAGSYVRIDGLTIRKARASCLRIEGGTSDHSVDGNVITDWNVDDDPGVQHEAGIAAWSNATRLVVLDNTLKRRDVVAGTQNGGGNGVWVRNQSSSGSAGGHHVIRGNTIVGGWDCIGSDVEADPVGGFYLNTDVYENVVSDAQDDGIQMEGPNLNCAVFANDVRRGRTGIAFAPTGIGPLFVMRNRLQSPTWLASGTLYKVGAQSDGRTWLFHESGYDADVGPGSGADAIQQTNPGLANLHTRNNAWHVDRYVIETTSASPAFPLDLDYDAFFSTDPSSRFVKWFETLRASLAAFQVADGQEPHGLERDLAALDWTNAADGDLTLTAAAALRDAGETIPGINAELEDPAWNFVGSGPDLGALERTSDDVPPMVAIAEPAADVVLAGTTSVTIDAIDAGGVRRVELRIDGTLAGSDASAPYTVAWTTTAVADGAHRLEAFATDTAGHSARSGVVRVLVDNGRGGARNAYLGLKAKAASGGRFTAREVEVADQFETKQTVVIRPQAIGSAAVHGTGAIVDPTAFLTCYKIKDASGAPRFATRPVEIRSAFGDERWEIRRAAELCLPATTDGGPVPAARDAFKCYPAKTAKGTPRFAARTVAVSDADGTRLMTVQKPSSFCTAARADGAAIVDTAARLACYRSKVASGEPRYESHDLPTSDAFGNHPLVAVKPQTLCVPAAEVP